MSKSVGMLLKKLTVTYGLVIDKRMAEIDVTKSQSDVLVQLILHGKLTQRELCDINGVTAASMSRMIHNLEEKQLITIEKSEADPRKNYVDLTPKAKQLEGEIVNIKETVHQAMMRGISTHEVEVLSQALDTMENNLAHLFEDTLP
ncbi:MAG: MarR family transcriptional regulator [Chloroflexota bacterium]